MPSSTKSPRAASSSPPAPSPPPDSPGFHPCVVIPIYNHKDTITQVVDSLEDLELPCFIVDDGSDSSTKQVLSKINLEKQQVEVITRSANGGKGAAVTTGLLAAFEKGFTHALQVDADGQHQTSDAQVFLERSSSQPDALVLGRPIFADNAPKSRVYGRRVTHFFVWLETLSLEIKDTLCGFRVYPLSAFKVIANKTRLRERMDFDPEIAVRMHWAGVPVLNINTPVKYDQKGLSHFDFKWDNLRMILLHTQLLLEMVVRLPSILFRRLG
ncbi:MAG: glycosyl transferase [Deltaproteobacteria bacterium]|nr:glycosyl transferase [Deltaproteobacteria bacterium]